jgi:hypothetical protein
LQIATGFNHTTIIKKSSSLKPTESYVGDVLTLWDKFKKLFDAKRKLDGNFCSKINVLSRTISQICRFSNYEDPHGHPGPHSSTLLASA